MGEVKSLRYSPRLGREIAGSGPEGNDGIQSEMAEMRRKEL